MKRYMMIMLMAATVGLTSAFTLFDNSQKASDKHSTFWFLMDDDGNVTTTPVSDPFALCPEIGDGCAREYDESQTQIINGVRSVKPGQVDLPISSRARE